MEEIQPIRVIVATRRTEADFWTDTATGRSLALYMPLTTELTARIHAENVSSLPEVYNREIELARSDRVILVLMHDDVHICDLWWPARLRQSLQRYDLVGVIGDNRRVPFQSSWRNPADRTAEQQTHYTGAIGIGTGYPPRRIVYGQSRNADAKLLDGLFLACESACLIENAIRFDDRFDFHFYDMDLCRQFERAGLSMGICDVTLIHESVNLTGGPDWVRAYETYVAKWGN